MAAGNPDMPAWMELEHESESGHRQYCMGGNYFLRGWEFLAERQNLVKREVRVTKCRERAIDIDRRKFIYKVEDFRIRGGCTSVDRG